MIKDLELLVAQYARSRDTLFHSIEGLNDAQLKELLPDRDWSVDDTLVHIATNEGRMTELLQAIAQGTSSALPADFDNERFNRESVAVGRKKSAEQLRSDLYASYGYLVIVLETITPEQMLRHGTHPAAGDTNVKEFFLAMYAHHEMHCRDVVEQSRRLKRTASA